MRLDGRCAVVFGGGQIDGETIGNGRATAVAFAREGASVVVADIDVPSAEATVALIEDAGGTAVAVRCDVTSEDDCADVIAAAVDRFGGIDIVFNNVGHGFNDGAITSIDQAAWSEMMDVNLKSMFLTSKHAIPVMRERGGVIINMSSMISTVSDSYAYVIGDDLEASAAAAYKVSKAGVNALTESMAATYAPDGIRVNAILPGFLDTPTAIESISDEREIDREALRAERAARVPLKGGQGSAWDVASAAVFLASDEAKFITGALLPVDGGHSVSG